MASWSFLGRLDRRFLFLLMALAIVIPYLMKVEPKVIPTEWAQGVYDAVEAVPPGGVVLVSCDYDPGSEAEIYPMNVALFHHLARKDVRVILTELWPQAGPLVEKALNKAYYPGGKEYGRDVVRLGYKTGGQILISKMVQSIPQAYPTDVKDTPVGEIPAMKGVRSLHDVDLIVTLSAGTPGTKEWVQQAQARISKPMASGCTAVSAPDFFPYVLSNQLVGLLGGLRGAADYETLVGEPGRAVRGMGPQTFGHLLIVLLILVGNIGFLVARRKRRAER
ncbi:MAG: hypothetical protein ACC662_01315 [Planctomycetota bacterium]